MITVKELQQDLLETLSRSGQSQLINAVRNDGRFYRIAFQAVKQFMIDASPTILQNYIQTVDLEADTAQGLNGVVDGVKFYKFPKEAYDLRKRNGILDLIIDGNQHNPQFVSSFYQATQIIQSEYMESADIGCVDIESGVIYADELADAKARIISLPDEFQPGIPTSYFISATYNNGTTGTNLTVAIEVNGTEVSSQTTTLSAESNQGAASAIVEALVKIDPDFDAGIINKGNIESIGDTNVVWKIPHGTYEAQPTITISTGEIGVIVEREQAGQSEAGEFDISSDYHNDIVDLVKKFLVPTSE